MRKTFKHLSLETLSSDELEVNKVLDDSVKGDKRDDFDNLYHDLKNKNDNPEESNDTDEDLDNEKDMKTSEKKEESTPDLDEEGLNGDSASLESFIAIHESISLENYSDPSDESKFSIEYLTKLGIRYAPIAGRRIQKAILYSIEKSLKAIMLGGVAINRFIRKRIETFYGYKKKIIKLKLALAEYEKLVDKPENDEKDLIFNNSLYISHLKIGNNYNFNKNTDILLNMLNDLNSSLRNKVIENINGIKYIINKVVEGDSEISTHIYPDTVKIKGLVKHELANYKPTSEYLDTLVYHTPLPGDQLLIAFCPKEKLNSIEEQKEACLHSKLFLGLDGKNINSPSAIPFIKISELGEFLNKLESICDHAIFKEKTYDTLVASRDSLKPNIRKYLDYLYESEEKITYKDSMVDAITMKIKFIDTTYIAGTLAVENYTLRYLNAATQYCMALLEANS